METNTKTRKFFDHGYSINSSVSGSDNGGLKNDSDPNKINAARKRKKCSRKRLEKLLLEKSEQLIQAHGDIEKLQASCQELKTEVKDWKAKSDSLAKTCSKLATKLKTDLSSNGKISKDIKRVNDNKDKKRKLSKYDDSKEEHKKRKHREYDDSKEE